MVNLHSSSGLNGREPQAERLGNGGGWRNRRDVAGGHRKEAGGICQDAKEKGVSDKLLARPTAFGHAFLWLLALKRLRHRVLSRFGTHRLSRRRSAAALTVWACSIGEAFLSRPGVVTFLAQRTE